MFCNFFKRVRIHAFVPGTEADELAKLLEVGKVYLIENFTVSDYTSDDKFRCVRKEIQIVFDNQTKITPLEEKAVNIEKHVFDFFDLSDLKSLVNQQTYLAGKFNYYISLIMHLVSSV